MDSFLSIRCANYVRQNQFMNLPIKENYVKHVLSDILKKRFYTPSENST